MSPFQTSTILLALIGLSAWFSLEGKSRLVAIGSLLGVYLILFGLGICMVRLGYFVRSFCRGRKPGAGVVLTFDDGPDPSGTKRLLEVLSRHGVKAAFFPIGMKAEAHPGLLREIDQEGHVIGNHSYRHAWFTNLLMGRSLEQEIVKAQNAVEAAVGKIPAFFRPPAGLTNPHFRNVLKRLRLHLVGWDVRVFDTRKKAENVVEGVLTQGEGRQHHFDSRRVQGSRGSRANVGFHSQRDSCTGVHLHQFGRNDRPAGLSGRPGQGDTLRGFSGRGLAELFSRGEKRQAPAVCRDVACFDHSRPEGDP